MRIKIFFSALLISLMAGQVRAAVEINIKGEISGVSSAEDSATAIIFDSNILVRPGEPSEVFTGPYTIQVNVLESASDTFVVATYFFGLGPDFHGTNYNIRVAKDVAVFVPPLPVKDGASVKYTFSIVGDSAAIDLSEPPLDDTTAWGLSESVHYGTHWLRGSLADYMWNVKMVYLERIYDGYRKSFGLSSFEKIEYVFHPQPINTAHIGSRGYGIQPRAMRIDAIYGHEVDGVTPASATELLIYKMWGYGPRWMATGFAGYYFDNFLQLRKFADKLDAINLAENLANESWVDSDTGRVISGAVAKWLVDNYTESKFMKLYRESTALDFETKFSAIFGRDFRNALAEFITDAKSYKPWDGELEHNASIYMDQGKYEAAREYLEELVRDTTAGAEKFRQMLARCLFWLGEYDEAGKLLAADNILGVEKCDALRNRINVAGGSKSTVTAHTMCAESGQSEALLALASYWLDCGAVEAADRELSKIAAGATNTPEYFIEAGRLNILKAQPADSLLIIAAAIALNRAQKVPHDPVNYLVAGQAFLLMRNYERAKVNLETAYFLEKRPYFLAQALLELGKLYDLMDQRDTAVEYYNQVLSIKAGAYQKSQAMGFLEKKFSSKS